MHHNNALFSAWSEADRQAREAERELYELILAQDGRPAAREDVERVRALRDKASELLAELLEGIRLEAQALRAPGEAGFSTSSRRS
jgi:hypothetical protein